MGVGSSQCKELDLTAGEVKDKKGQEGQENFQNVMRSLLEFTKAHKDWNEAKRNRAVWSDETMFEISAHVVDDM